MEDMREELKSEVAKLGPRGRGKPYPKGLLEKILSYTVARRRQGAKLVEVAAELGLHDQALSRWLGEKRASKRFDRLSEDYGCSVRWHSARNFRTFEKAQSTSTFSGI